MTVNETIRTIIDKILAPMGNEAPEAEALRGTVSLLAQGTIPQDADIYRVVIAEVEVEGSEDEEEVHN